MTYTFSNKPIATRSNNEITVGRIGHSTVLINLFGTWIITDPVFSNWFGIPVIKTPLNLGVKRLRPPHIHIRDLPEIDIILLSHSHMDHLHPWSCKSISKHSHGKTKIISAPGVKQWLSRDLQAKTSILDRGQEIQIDEIHITACEVNHRGARYPWGRDRMRKHKNGASYNAYMIEKNGKRIFFGGDTAYTEVMKTYKPASLDLAIMPIGSYDPWIYHHCNPEQALQMIEMLGGTKAVGIHWDSRGRPAKKREGDTPLKRFIESAPIYGIDVLWKYEGDVIVVK